MGESDGYVRISGPTGPCAINNAPQFGAGLDPLQQFGEAARHELRAFALRYPAGT